MTIELTLLVFVCVPAVVIAAFGFSAAMLSSRISRREEERDE